MCDLCLQSHCHNLQRVCGCKRHESKLIKGSEWPKPKPAKKIACEYCGLGTNRKKPNRPMDFVFKDGMHLCFRCSTVKRCNECNGEISRLGCMVCKHPNKFRDVLDQG